MCPMTVYCHSSVGATGESLCSFGVFCLFCCSYMSCLHACSMMLLHPLFSYYADQMNRKSQYKWCAIIFVKKSYVKLESFNSPVAGSTKQQCWHIMDIFSCCLLELVSMVSYVPQESDPVVAKLYDSTEEGMKVTRNKGDKFCAVFRRIQDPLLTVNTLDNNT